MQMLLLNTYKYAKHIYTRKHAIVNCIYTHYLHYKGLYQLVLDLVGVTVKPETGLSKSIVCL